MVFKNVRKWVVLSFICPNSQSNVRKNKQFVPAQFYKITTEGKKNGLRKPARTSTFCLTYNMPTTLQSYS